MNFENFYTFDELDMIASIADTYVDGVSITDLLSIAEEATGRAFIGELTDENVQCFIDEWCEQ